MTTPTLKKFYHKPTKEILKQCNFYDYENYEENSEDENYHPGHFTFITSHHLANMGDDPYTIDIVAKLEDCIDLEELRQKYDKIEIESNYKSNHELIYYHLSNIYQIETEIIKQLLNTF